MPSRDRIYVNRGLFLGFPIFQPFDGGFFVQAIEGVDGEAPLVFDVSSGDTRSEQLPRNEIYAHATHFFALPADRRILIEYVRRGAKSTRIGNAIENIAREHIQGYQDLRVEITPKISTNFSSQVNNFERIREAAIRVVRPNASWTDHYTEISDLIEDSSGNSATLDVKAGRGEALAKRKGIVQVIKDVVRDKEPYLQEATVTGTRPDETSEVTIRASRFISQAQTRVEADANKNVAPTDMRSKLARMASSLVWQARSRHSFYD